MQTSWDDNVELETSMARELKCTEKKFVSKLKKVSRMITERNPIVQVVWWI